LPVEDFIFSAGGGFLFGAVAGYAIKKVMKIAAVVVGLFVAALAYLSYKGFIDVKWIAMENATRSAFKNVAGRAVHALNSTATQFAAHPSAPKEPHALMNFPVLSNSSIRLLPLSTTYILPLVSSTIPLGSFNWPLPEPKDPIVFRRVCAYVNDEDDPTKNIMTTMVTPVTIIDRRGTYTNHNTTT